MPENNPLLESFQTPFETVPFQLINKDHFIPAIEASLQEAKNNIEAIINNTEKPDFANTIEALDNCDEVMAKAQLIYDNLYSAESDDAFKELADTLSPMTAEFSSSICTNGKLFEKVKAVYSAKESMNLDLEQNRLLENIYKMFVRNGALLSEEKKNELKEIDIELSKLGPHFMKNTLGATNAWEKHITDKELLAGLPETALEAAALAARKKEKEGWLITLQMPSYIAVTTYADNRELREEVVKAFKTRATEGEFDNRENVRQIVELRRKRAVLLGYETHCHYTLEERMAETPETVINFTENLLDKSFEPAKKEVEELRAFAKEKDGIEELQVWDASYYAEKLKKERYDFDEEELKPYFQSEKVIDGMFQVAEKLYDLTFTPNNDIPVYHKDVQTFEVKDKSGEIIGIFYVDLYPRETKRGGAWMYYFRLQGENKIPHISIVGNLTPPTENTPSLLTYDEASTLFHEFGHALHGLLSKVKYTSLASPNVLWDFVELPSQIMENWLEQKEVLELFARHYKTGELIPDELVEKVKKSKNFMAGSRCLRQLSLGALDMNWYLTDPAEIDDVIAFEKKTTERFRLYPDSPGAISTNFGHIFGGGYSSGYYSYKWAEVLDADAFEYFKEKGIFDKEVAASFRDNVLSRGNTEPPMDLYVRFRGKKPDPEALLRRDGLI